MRYARLLVVFLSFSAVLISACGSSDPGPLTKAEFLKQGSALCSQLAGKQREAIDSFDGSKASAGEMEEVVAAALGPVKDLAGELRSLEGPRAATKAVKVYAIKLEAAVTKAEANPPVAVSGVVFESANKAAERAGLRACVI
jgi:hypothetical protein